MSCPGMQKESQSKKNLSPKNLSHKTDKVISYLSLFNKPTAHGCIGTDAQQSSVIIENEKKQAEHRSQAAPSLFVCLGPPKLHQCTGVFGFTTDTR